MTPPPPLEPFVDSLLKHAGQRRVLEAGCGSSTHFRHHPEDHITGIDVSPEQLERSTYLQEKILGDIQEPGVIPPGRFDLIVCWDVLEHLPHPRRALEHFAQGLRPGGLMLLSSPNVLTVRGLLTKMAPHALKVAYYRHVVGNPHAGEPGYGPFRSYHRFAMSPAAIRRFAQARGLRVELYSFSSWDHPEYHYRLFSWLWNPVNRAVCFLTAGAIGTDEKQGYKIILRKPE